MNFYIKEWPNKTATLMLSNGCTLFTFRSVDDAVLACKDWYRCHVNENDQTDTRQDRGVATLIK